MVSHVPDPLREYVPIPISLPQLVATGSNLDLALRDSQREPYDVNESTGKTQWTLDLTCPKQGPSPSTRTDVRSLIGAPAPNIHKAGCLVYFQPSNDLATPNGLACKLYPVHRCDDTVIDSYSCKRLVSIVLYPRSLPAYFGRRAVRYATGDEHSRDTARHPLGSQAALQNHASCGNRGDSIAYRMVF